MISFYVIPQMEKTIFLAKISAILLGFDGHLNKMFNLHEEKVECALGNNEFCFWQGKKAENVVFLFNRFKENP